MNKDLTDELQLLLGQGMDNKIEGLMHKLELFPLELRGKANPDLQISASALVFVGRKLFFIEHPYQKEWLLPAGHVEKGEQPIQAAIREFNEETGYFVGEKGTLVDANIISIPLNEKRNEKAHQHIDFRYLLKLEKEKVASSAELPFNLLSQEEAPEEFKKIF
ncbi:NUDIX domain-containing protein [Lactococcus fujiensis]|uniref:NUDIX domain-containing protein n=1 Tax=Lactococcus fujiensis TaxID=610251 RepID=UPI0006D0FF60|nr:NUDIX domain-containing protein [Lactococcus fujiensis]